MSDLYDQAWLYDVEHDDYRDDLGFYRRLAEDQAGAVLELGAGTGRVTMALASTGLPVVALEPNPTMLDRARARLADAARRDPTVLERVRLVQGDARTLQRSERFALALAPFNTLMHFEHLAEQDAVLARVREHLHADGAFACDVFAPRFAADGVVRSEAVWSDVAGPGGDLFVWQHHDPVSQRITSHHRLDRVDPDGVVRRSSATLRQRYFHRYELERALRQAGFDDVRCYGDFERGPLRESSTVWAFVARQRAR